MNQSTQSVGSALAPIGLLGGRKELSVQVTEADNGFILSWYDTKENTRRTYLCLMLEEVGVKFTELFSH